MCSCMCVCVQSPLVLCASHPNTTDRIPDIPVGRNYSTLGTFTSLLLAYGGQMIRTKWGTQNTHRKAEDTMYTMRCWWTACVCNYTGELKEKAHCVACTQWNVHTEATEPERSGCTKNSRRRHLWSWITKRYAWHTYTHISTHKGQTGTQGHVMLGFMSGTEVGVTHTREGHTPSWKTPREHMRTARDVAYAKL